MCKKEKKLFNVTKPIIFVLFCILFLFFLHVKGKATVHTHLFPKCSHCIDGGIKHCCNISQMDANKSELVLSNSMFASDDQFSEDDLLDANGGQAVTWLNDDENEKLDMSINIDATNMFFNRVESAEIIYQAKKKTCKMIGKYVMGDKLGEGKSHTNTYT